MSCKIFTVDTKNQMVLNLILQGELKNKQMTYVKFNQPSLKSLDSFFDNLLNEIPSSQSNGFNFPPVNISETKENLQS